MIEEILCWSIIFASMRSFASASQTNPNIVLFIIDDLRPALGCYGDQLAITPAMDEIAASGITFTRAYAQQALCGPSRTSFLTSRRPDTTKLIDVHYYWRHHVGNFTTLPEFFKENGYHTVTAGKVFHPGIVSNHNDDQPFSWSEVPYHPPSERYKNAAVCPSQDGHLHSNIYCPVKIKEQPEKTLPDIETTKFIVKWLKKRYEKYNLKNGNEESGLKPFLLAVGLQKPHIPLKFPVEFLDLYPLAMVPLAPNRYFPKHLPMVAWNPWNDLRWRDDIIALNLSFPLGPMPDKYARLIRQGYYASVSYIDSLIYQIKTVVKSLFPNTILALIGDHGWSLGEHQEWSKFSNFEVATRVPFIISIPKVQKDAEKSKLYLKHLSADGRNNFLKYFKQYIKSSKKYASLKRQHKFRQKRKIDSEGRQFNGIVELIDLFPTLADLAGLPSIPTCHPRSRNEKLCTEGASLACILQTALDKDVISSCPRKGMAVSQYPRPGIIPSVSPDSDQCSLVETTIMGYSVRTSRFRYTTWRPFNSSNFSVNWNKSFGDELYNHKFDDGESNNLFRNSSSVVKRLKKILRRVSLKH